MLERNGRNESVHKTFSESQRDLRLRHVLVVGHTVDRTRQRSIEAVDPS